MTVQIYDERYHHIEVLRATGNRKLHGTLNNAAAVNNGGLARIAITGHGLTAGCKILIAGSVAYNGVYTVVSVHDANNINTDAPYVAENFAGTETYKVAVGPIPCDFQLVETRLVLSGASAAENFVVLLDANAGATYDCTLQTVAMSGLTQNIKVWMAGDERRIFDKGDVIYFEHANTNNRTWTLTFIYRRKA